MSTYHPRLSRSSSNHGGVRDVSVCLVAITSLLSIPMQADFSLRTNPPPKEWKIAQINDGLPYRWETGVVHVLAWEVIEDDRPRKYTQILVLKKFDKPTENGGHTWVLAQLCHHPDGKDWPWRGSLRIGPPLAEGEKMPHMTDAQVFGHEFYKDIPTDVEIERFLRETSWTPDLGTSKWLGGPEDRTITTKLAAGGIDRALWKKLLNREVPTKLFPELKKANEKKE